MLATDMVDPETGEIYPALSCCNNQEMADRCTDIRAPTVIWSIKASAQFNNDCAILLREGFRSGKIRLLENEYDARELLAELPKYKSLTEEEKSKLLLPYIHTTLLIDELINLQHDESSGKIKLKERTGWRKDRYSSLAYNYYVATQLEARLSRKRRGETASPERFLFRAPRTKRG